MKAVSLVVVFLAMFSVGFVAAQAPPAAAPVIQAKVEVPLISAQDQQAYGLLNYRAQVQAEAVAVLQKEIDSTNAEIGRLVHRLQMAGFDLTRDPQTGALVRVAKPVEPKK